MDLYLEFSVGTTYLVASVYLVYDYVEVSVAANLGGKRLRKCGEVPPFPWNRPIH